jgi:hypothetical protein
MNGEELVMMKKMVNHMMKKMVNHKMKNMLNKYMRMNHKMMKKRMRKKHPLQKIHQKEFKRITLKAKSQGIKVRSRI